GYSLTLKTLGLSRTTTKTVAKKTVTTNTIKTVPGTNIGGKKIPVQVNTNSIPTPGNPITTLLQVFPIPIPPTNQPANVTSTAGPVSDGNQSDYNSESPSSDPFSSPEVVQVSYKTSDGRTITQSQDNIPSPLGDDDPYFFYVLTVPANIV